MARRSQKGRSSGGRVLGPTWVSSQAQRSATPVHVSRTRLAAAGGVDPLRSAELPNRDQALAPEQLDTRVILRIAARRGLEFVDRADGVLALLGIGDEGGEFAAGRVTVDR